MTNRFNRPSYIRFYGQWDSPWAFFDQSATDDFFGLPDFRLVNMVRFLGARDLLPYLCNDMDEPSAPSNTLKKLKNGKNS